jgi:hypothetical protein
MKTFKIALVTLLVLVSSSMVMHPLKMSTTELTYKEGKLVIKTKMFTDDLEMTMRAHCNVPTIDLVNIGFDKMATTCLKKHYFNNFKISQNGKEIKLNFKKVYLNAQKEVSYVELESNKVTLTTNVKLKIQNTLLFQNIPEQKNIINADLEGTGKFDKTIIFEHEKEETVKDLGF